MKFTGIAVCVTILASAAAIAVSSGPQSWKSDCGPRPRPENGQAVFTTSRNWRRAVEVYQCDVGYVLTGETKRTCVGGEWSGRVPSCTRHGSRNNVITVAEQGWFSFRRLLELSARRQFRNDGGIQSETKSTDVELSQTSAVEIRLTNNDNTRHNAFQLPKHMIRDSSKVYSSGDYDLSCLFRKRHGKHFLRAPKLPYAHVVKYSRKKNTVGLNNKYLEAIYGCGKGHILENPSQNKLYCSNGRWVGIQPSCVPKTTPMTTYQMECYIKCPPDKNVSLAKGEASVHFEVERPKTNYDWDRFGTLSSGWSKNSSRTLAPGFYVITYTVRDEEDADIASCRTTVRVTDDEVPTVKDCPLYLEMMENFSKNDTVPVSWPEPRFSDNVAVTQVAKTMEPGRLLEPGLYNVLYMAMDASKNEATCNFTIKVKVRLMVNAMQNRQTNKTLNEVI